ncbi:lactonase family protein [Halalkalibacter kiskunsagensis]|uniref:Lactonase family protein n=1 Tax=Halalkalibacter kiskunsagensis TaxID=1548599 RepID=A0ABV6KJS8_9BACI
MANKLTAYVGTYTKGDSKGIYRFSMDDSTGEIDKVVLSAQLENPTYLTINEDNTYLYSVIKLEDQGGVAAYSIQADGQLELMNHEVTDGSPPCHVSLDSSNHYLFSANYHKGTAIAYKLTDSGELTSQTSIITHEGNGPHDRQEKPHAHFAGLTPDEKLLCVVDLGTDEMGIYHFNNGTLVPFDKHTFKPGTGPRHIQFHPNQKFAYVNGELSSEVIALQYDSISGSFTDIQYITSLPAGYNEESIGGAIKISANGQYLYASNRGHDSIAVFRIDSDSGELTLVDHTSTEGSFPRDFTIDPTGKFLLVANQNTSNIVQYAIDQLTGKLTKTDVTISIPNPVCIVFS